MVDASILGRCSCNQIWRGGTILPNRDCIMIGAAKTLNLNGDRISFHASRILGKVHKYNDTKIKLVATNCNRENVILNC